MKILAIEYETKKADWSLLHDELEVEARKVYELYREGYIREIYFNEHNSAVIIMECESLQIAKELLNSLPLVKNKRIRFSILQLKPYTGFLRLMKEPAH